MKIQDGFFALRYLMRHPIKALLAIRIQQYKEKIIIPPTFPEVDFSDLFGDCLFPEIFPISYISGASNALDYTLLNMFAQQFNACSYLEIGTWRGESIVNVARYAEHCVSVSLSKDQLEELGFDQCIRAANFYCKKIPMNNIEIIGANSYDFDFSSLGRKFDLIFIDADHSYEGILNDTKKVYPLLKDENSVIVWHDYLNDDSGDVVESTAQAIFDGLPEKEHKYLYGVKNTKCAIFTHAQLTRKQKFSKYDIPTEAFRVQVEQIKF